MATIRPFMAIRPASNYAKDVAALPYDVMNSEEAREMVKDKPWSFLHVDKAEVDLPVGTDIYSDEVYQKAKENLENMIGHGVIGQDLLPNLYIYRLPMNGKSQTGLVCCTSVDEYIDGTIKKHELTRADKEADRIRHVDYCDANTGPIFLTYRKNEAISTIVNAFKENNAPVYDFITEDGITNTVWVIDDKKITDTLCTEFGKIDYLYIADGHHRCASAVKVGQKRREANPDYTGNEEFNFFLAVAFPEDELEIMDYNRVMKDLNGYSEEEFITKLSEKFTVEAYEGEGQYKPEKKHTFGMYLGKKWDKVTAKEGTFNADDPVEGLDVSILQNNCITPIFGISDPRTDKRIDFVGGIRGLGELERRCKADMRIAFSMYPTSLTELMDIADAGKVMPPKSTWFEPKLLSGLFIHKLK